MINPDWKKFKKSFTKEQEDALWQYFVDHTNLEKSNGFYFIYFKIRDIDDFWKRVWARYSGEFIRYEKLEKESERNRIAWIIHQKRLRKIELEIEKIKKGKNLFKKIILFINRKTKIYLFGENNP